MPEEVVPAGAEAAAGSESAAGVAEVTPTAAPAPAAAIPVDWEARVKEWGGEDTIADALKIHQALGTETGAAQLLVEAGRALGLTYEQLNSLFGEEEPGTPAGAAGSPPEPDSPVTYAQLQELLTKTAAPQQAAIQEIMLAGARQVIEAEVTRLDLGDDREMVLDLGSKHLADGDFDPDHIRAAIAKGYDEFNAAVEARMAKKLGTAQQVRDTAPAPLAGGGGSPGGEVTPKEFKNLDEAKKAVRDEMRSRGELPV